MQLSSIKPATKQTGLQNTRSQSHCSAALAHLMCSVCDDMYSHHKRVSSPCMVAQPADTSREQNDLCANCSDPQPLPSPPDQSRVASSPGCLIAPHHSAGCCCHGCCCQSGVTLSTVNLPVKLAFASAAANDCNAQVESVVAESS